MNLFRVTKRVFAYSLAGMNKSKRKLPKVIQLPITSRCNSRCKTCNVWKLSKGEDINPVMLRQALQDPFFREVETVGINGGELSLVPNIAEIVEAILVLPQLTTVYVISNGLIPTRLFKMLANIKSTITGNKQVSLHFCLSVDGYGKIHELVRGVPNCFVKTKTILDELKDNSQKYCDSWSIGCTISKYNIAYIRETENFLSSYHVPVEYHLAVPNKRIGTFADHDYSVLGEPRSRMLAAEYFYEDSLDDSDKARRYYSMYHYLKNGGRGRLNECAYLNRDVTIDQDLNISLCATASNIVGSLLDNPASYYYQSGKLDQTEKELKKCCDTCIHYSYHPLSLKGMRLYVKECLRKEYVYEYYRIRCQSPSFQKLKNESIFFSRMGKKYLKMLYRQICMQL